MYDFDKVRFYNLKALGIKKARKFLINLLCNSEKFQDCFDYHYHDFYITSVYVVSCSSGDFVLEINCSKPVFNFDKPGLLHSFVKDTCFWFLNSDLKEKYI